MSGKHGRPKPSRRSPEPVSVGAAAARVTGVGAAAAGVTAVGAVATMPAPALSAPTFTPAAPTFTPPASTFLPPATTLPPPPPPPVIHNRPLPDFDRDNPLGIVESPPAWWAERPAELGQPEPEPEFEPAPEPAPALAALPLANEILPSQPASNGGALGSVLADRRRLLLAVLALVVVVGLVAWLLAGGSGTSSKKAPAAAAAGRTQSTLLIELKGNLGMAVDSALVAHDPADHDGVVVLVPSNVQTQVPGFGSMPFGQALSIGDPNAPTGALSDLIGVTVDGSWTLTQSALAALVDKIGGVAVAVDKDVTSTDASGTTSIVVPAGTQKLSGAHAALFASFLATGETVQAELARFDAVLKQVLAGLPKSQADLAATLSSLGAGSTTSFAPARLTTFLLGLAADSAAGTMTDQLLPVTALDTGSGQDAYTLDTANTSKLVAAQLATSVPASRQATGNRVYVQNQVGTPGLGASARGRLVAAGFVYVQGQNTADMPNATAPSVVVILGPTSTQIDQGDAVARSLGLPISDVRVANDGFTVADVLVKLGADYKG
jgi:anionic cell wall polymer biosynthesis LytR-Cps2A-Psr (LCP) family protein